MDILGMTGNRGGLTNEAKITLIAYLENNAISEVHHGDCIGADKDFHDICEKRGIKIVIHPPTNGKDRAFCKSSTILEAKPYLDRNKDIVNCADTIIAFPSNCKEQLRSGTWSTIRYARKMKKQLIIVYPDGST